MTKDTSSSSKDPLKSKAYFIIGYIFLMAMALAWSVDTSLVYIFFGIAVFFLFLGFYSRPSGKIFQEPFKSTSHQSGGPTTTSSDIFARIFQQPHHGTRPTAKTFRPSTPEDNRRIVSFVIAGVFTMFFIFFILFRFEGVVFINLQTLNLFK